MKIKGFFVLFLIVSCLKSTLVTAQEKPLITTEDGKNIFLLGMSRYAKSYCLNRKRGFIDEDASSMAMDDAVSYIYHEADKYYLGTETMLFDEMHFIMLETFPKYAEKKCPEFFASDSP